MSNVNIDFSKKIGPMKPLHGVNNGPLTCLFQRDARHLFKEAEIPFSRLHDTEYPFGSGEFVDVPCIFKNFNADVNDPESYDFALTDIYLKTILQCNTKIIYRLGTSIEHSSIKIRVHPPKDFKKWAQICEHIIMHMNEGWANGHHMGIEYWEIWNEADLGDKMWTGTVEQFAELYTVTATHLKNRFPNLKIGGCAFCTPKRPYVDEFFKLITKDGARPPMDFYSWHGYCYTPDHAGVLANAADEVIKKYGYENAESIYDEWNYVKAWDRLGESYRIIQSYKGTAFDAAVMSVLQNSPCDIATYYDAQLKLEDSWCGIFKTNPDRLFGSKVSVVPRKPFYAFKAFNEVYKCRKQIELSSDDEKLYGVAACDDEKAAILLSTFADPFDEQLETKTVSVNLNGIENKMASVYISDENRDLELVASFPAKDTLTVTMPPYSMVLIKLENA